MDMFEWMDGVEELGWLEKFFSSWGLDPGDPCADIPYAIYLRMLADARVHHGERFARFVDSVLAATDGRWYLQPWSWEEVYARHRATT